MYPRRIEKSSPPKSSGDHRWRADVDFGFHLTARRLCSASFVGRIFGGLHCRTDCRDLLDRLSSCPHSGLSFPVEICLLLLDIHSGLYETIMT